MKSIVISLLLVAALGLIPQGGFAAQEEPTIYIIKQGDTLWGLSKKFLTDPFYWPDLWARNQAVTNPHFVFPGQKIKVYSDHIEIEAPAPAAVSEVEVAPSPVKKQMEEAAPERAFTVTGGEGFLMEKELKPTGYIIGTYQDRLTVGDDDVVYTDIGKRFGAKVGDRYSIYNKMGAVSHPVTNEILGYQVLPLGTLQLSELEATASKAIITKSYLEVSAGAFLMPYRDRHREVSLVANARDLTGYIVETRNSAQTIAPGDIVYTDLGRRQGVVAGNMMYVVRDVKPDQKFVDIPVDRLPTEVIGAVVIVETNENTSTALVVKGIDTIYRGDRLEMKKSR
jgi:hypothetical protein